MSRRKRFIEQSMGGFQISNNVEQYILMFSILNQEVSSIQNFYLGLIKLYLLD